MTVKDTKGTAHWAMESGRYAVTQHKRRLAIVIAPGESGAELPESEIAPIFYWLLNDESDKPRFDEDLARPEQIISVSSERWVEFPSNGKRITIEIAYDPYPIPGRRMGQCD